MLDMVAPPTNILTTGDHLPAIIDIEKLEFDIVYDISGAHFSKTSSDDNNLEQLNWPHTLHESSFINQIESNDIETDDMVSEKCGKYT